MFSKLTDSFRQQGTTLWCIAALVVVAAAIAAPWMNPYYTRVMTMGLMCGYLAASWNLIGGYAGQMSLGHALFFAIGSYSVALLARIPDVPLVAAFPLAILVSVGLAWIIATICFRYALRGIYFAVGTLLLAEIARILVINSDMLGRSQGLQIPGMQGALNFSFGSDLPFFYIFLGISIALALGSLALERCKLGYDLVALREQEEGAQALGVDVAAIKRLAFVLSAALTCVGGVIYAGLVRYVEPGYDLSLSITLFMVMGAVLGGRGTALGPFLGGVVMVIVQETLITVGSAFGTTSVSALAQMIYGLFFVVILLAFPRGIVGQLLHRRIDRKATRLPANATPEAS
ncbi:branched-chain amino acid ABC transporter, permease protein [Bordetella bronchiseptica MBORD675]|uniref:branched-chain amino acid ABC transporter permease n=1 Tax=Bordetella bronchiseptica TaxID=518 RepID=UPI00028F8AD8|nr:branched-chain amino acid ABC transporter permease [Bordetella bronchiseptica]KCV29486.1 branched-chain amino acid ABC transporter, permease protein [Bordetella bronchiseptica 00-P-2730]KDC99316.1 branched-chain amino acid ABC transporter, permease protein [Bordetella bronchiseptica MBORD675]KDD96659.1 branched-chain amino acid ABC transporter, permease protein [Bordetella bronchiseptica SBL-F6116]QET69261.1 branched-chain amino acid ABC transporter permease [Bordetella bronchiseptica]CCN04